MSIITGQFSYQIEDLDIKNANFYLGKNDGIIYLQDFDPIHPSEKDNIYWNPSEYCLKLVSSPDQNNEDTIPIFPIPTTFDELIPSYENNSQKVWMYHSEFAIENTIEYIKFYITEEPADPTVTSTYGVYTLDSNNELVPFTYTPPMTQKKHIEISIKKSNGSSNVYTGTWYSMTETFDVIKFSHKEGYDYKYKLRLSIYQGILNNIDDIESTVNTTSELIQNITNLLIITDPVSNTLEYLIRDEFNFRFPSLNGIMGNETINTNLIILIEPLIDEIIQIITDSEVMFRPIDYYNLQLEASSNNEDPDEIGLTSYMVTPANCTEIVDPDNTTITIRFIPLNLNILEKFDPLDPSDLSYKIKEQTELKMMGQNPLYLDSDVVSSDNNNNDLNLVNGNILTWGNSANGGSNNTNVSLDDINLKEVVSIYNTKTAFAALKEDGSVVTWGDAASGGDSTTVYDGPLENVTKIFGNETAFAALKEDKSVTIWGNIGNGGGHNFDGGSTTDMIGLLVDVIDIKNTSNAFSALTTTGTVLSWGRISGGGDNSSVQSDLTDIVNIYSTGFAFAAVKSNGDVITWGGPTKGGDSSSVQLTNIEEIFNTETAFAALDVNGDVITWGDATNGGDSSSIVSSLTNVTNIFSTKTAFVSLKNDDTAISWGLDGGDSSSVTLSNINTIYSNDYAFVAIKNDDTVVAWGDQTNGGDISGIDLTNIDTIFNTSTAFAALKTDGTVVTWGDQTNGGDSTGLDLTDIIKIYSTDYAFAAVKSNGTVITWGGDVTDGIVEVNSQTLSNVTEIVSNGYAFAAFQQKIILSYTSENYQDIDPSTYSTDRIQKIIVTSNVPDVNIYYTLFGTTPSINEQYNSSVSIITGNQEPYENTFDINKYKTTYADLISYIEQSIVEINKFTVILNVFLNQQIDFRRSYVNTLNHYQIFTINNYKAEVNNWFSNCDKSCLENAMTVSLKKLKYNSNINIIDSMLANIRNIYHIGKLQEKLIDKLKGYLEIFIALTNSIDLNDPNNNEYALAFELYIPRIIEEVDDMSNFIIYNGSHIFNDSDDPNNPNIITYRFISSSTNSDVSGNDLEFKLPDLNSSELNITNLNPDPNTDDNLYSDVTNNISTILSIYNNAHSTLESKKSTFNSLKVIIDLRIKTIIDFIEYTKNLIDD